MTEAIAREAASLIKRFSQIVSGLSLMSCLLGVACRSNKLLKKGNKLSGNNTSSHGT